MCVNESPTTTPFFFLLLFSIYYIIIPSTQCVLSSTEWNIILYYIPFCGRANRKEIVHYTVVQTLAATIRWRLFTAEAFTVKATYAAHTRARATYTTLFYIYVLCNVFFFRLFWTKYKKF